MSSRGRLTGATEAPAWFTIETHRSTLPHHDVIAAVNAGVRPVYTTVFCRETPLWEIARLLDEFAFPSKKLALCISIWYGGLPESLWDGHEFANLVDLNVTGHIQGSLLLALLLRMPALKHLTLAMDDICVGEAQEDEYPPFTLETLTCRGTCWADDGWWLLYTTCTLNTRCLRFFVFECNESNAFSACFKSNDLARHLTTARLFLYYLYNGGSLRTMPQSIEDTLREDEVILQRCTSLRVLQVGVNWPSNDVPQKLERIFAALPVRLRALELYATPDTVDTHMAATDSFLSAQLTSAPGLSALTDLKVSSLTAFSPGETFPALLRACRLRRVRFQSAITPARH